jgi:RsiW-degrading membrane proteinase PrsW (M82 family)
MWHRLIVVKLLDFRQPSNHIIFFLLSIVQLRSVLCVVGSIFYYDVSVIFIITVLEEICKWSFIELIIPQSIKKIRYFCLEK